jgi:hypothetical protein
LVTGEKAPCNISVLIKTGKCEHRSEEDNNRPRKKMAIHRLWREIWSSFSLRGNQPCCYRLELRCPPKATVLKATCGSIGR